MELADAALAVLRDSVGQDLHWTVIWDQALTRRYVDAFTQASQRDEFLRAIAGLVKDGLVEKTSKGTYRIAGNASPDLGR